MECVNFMFQTGIKAILVIFRRNKFAQFEKLTHIPPSQHTHTKTQTIVYDLV